MYEENMKSTISPTVKRAYRLIKMIQEIKCSPRQAVAQLIDNLGISKAQFYKDRNALADLFQEESTLRRRVFMDRKRNPHVPGEPDQGRMINPETCVI